MATFKELTANDFKVRRSFLDQVVDVIQEDISGSDTRQRFQVFVTGGVGPGVTSSLFHTVYDQAFTAQTANPVLDITIGLYATSSIVDSAKSGEDANGKFLFPSQSMMMREKIFMYQQHAQKLLGDANAQFVAPFGSSNASDEIDAALFLNFKRLFHRDQIKRETFIMGFYQTGTLTTGGPTDAANLESNSGSVQGFHIYTDIGASVNKEVTFGGQVSDIVDASNTSRTVGLLFNDAGLAVLDLNKVVQSDQIMSGVIDAMKAGTTATNTDAGHGQTILDAPFIPNFLTSASIDDIVDHIASTRFGSGTLSSMVFENITNINSTLIFTRLGADEFNYSSNPTYVDDDDRIVVIDEGQEETQKSFTMITTLGFFDGNDNLLAVAKFSRPIEKNDERDVTYTTRLDF